MATPGGPPAIHRSVANIRSPPGSGSSHHHQRDHPSTPTRPVVIPSSNFGSPSSLRADEDIIVVEFGTRKLNVGFGGDAAPRGCSWLGPDQSRRIGDFRDWQPEYRHDWRQATSMWGWGRDHELWQGGDVRGTDLGLIGDKIERALRDAFTKYMLIDSRPRRMVCVFPSGLPIPMLSATLDSLFSRFQSPTISLLSSAVALTVGAGVRSALVVDLGWAETVITSVYEYREVQTTRSVRGGRYLVEQTHKLLAKHLPDESATKSNDGTEGGYKLSFEECNDIATRMVWCKPSKASKAPTASQKTEGLETLVEQDESETPVPAASVKRPGRAEIPLRSCRTPTTLNLPWDELAEPCENAFFDSQYSHSSFDDHELPLDLLVYRSLLQLPLDVRALCMSRIVFTGGCTNVLGLRRRIFDDVSHMVQGRGWDAVQGKAFDQMRANPKLKRKGARQATAGPTDVASQSSPKSQEQDGVWHDAANTVPEVDLIEEQLKRGQDKRPRMEGQMRAIESLGAWSGASLITHLKAPTVSTVDREIWLQHGAAGATKAADVDQKSARQSLGPGGLLRAANVGTSWTLGVWGTG
ncbi:hypothetical protein QBC43DRAFT_311521 [Cladorrhinum sp. PSN259]|nr:hypothetical protein QBC43DRAFT_311521 [Cladorrhinum sp. PSN259]